MNEGAWVGGLLLEGLCVVHRHRKVRDRFVVLFTLIFTIDISILRNPTVTCT